MPTPNTSATTTRPQAAPAETPALARAASGASKRWAVPALLGVATASPRRVLSLGR